MAEFASLELVDWDLQAIVRGSTGDYYNFCSTTSTDQPNSCYDLMEMPKENDLDDFLFCFPELLDTAAMLTDELQELCKPFYTVSDSSPAQNSPPGPTTPSISVCKKEPADIAHHHDHQDQPASAAATAYTPKYKRRKNQQKRVVLQVTAEDLSSDKWAWRKYGQKPIKGSPYPRSYYRCSSSKGCLARKQVEESCTDPGIFIITYTAEHSHSQPTRKNALAGTIRQKFSTPKCNSNTTPKNRGSRKCSPSPSLVSSPKTPQLLAEEEFLGRNIERRENKDENDREMVDVSRNNGLLVPEVMFDDDFFSGLGDLDGLISELGDGHCSTEAVSSESDLL